MSLKLIKRLLFLVLLIKTFRVLYKQSEKKDFKSLFKIACITAAAIVGLLLNKVAVSELNTIVSNNSVQTERVISANPVENVTKSVKTSYFNSGKRKKNSNQALILSQNVKNVNSDPDFLISTDIVSKMLQIRGGDKDWKFGPGNKARGAAAANKGKGQSLFAEAFSPTIKNTRYVGQNPLSGRCLLKPKNDPFNHPGNGGNNCGNHGGGSNDSRKYNKYEYEPYQETENERCFREWSINPQTKQQDQKSIDEAKAMLEVKRENVMKDLSRPKDPSIDLDIEGKGLKHYEGVTFGDVKTPESVEALEARGIKPSGPKTYAAIGKRMGRKIIKQKSAFCHIEGRPKRPEEVLHIVDLRKIPSYTNKSTLVTTLLDAAEKAGNTTKNIHFLNFD